MSLASAERIRIIRLLRDRPHNVTELAEKLGLADKPVNVSHHLNVLRHAGLVRNEKQGRFVVYSLVPGAILPGGDECDRLDLGCCRLEMPRPDEE
jgi:DNA-binding transcriptional ArsR family regulator